MHWTDKQSAIVNIGLELKHRGWTLFGYNPGESGQFDNYTPAYWSGVATSDQHPNVVVGVHVTSSQVKWNDTDQKKKGWPDFHATPNRRAWHVEYNGQVVASGTGLQACVGHNKDAHDAVAQLVNSIEDAVAKCGKNGHSTTTATVPMRYDTSYALDASAGGRLCRVEYNRDWTWVYFPCDPGEAVKSALETTYNARFSGKRQGWYITRHVDKDEVVQALKKALATESAASAPEPMTDPSTGKVLVYDPEYARQFHQQRKLEKKYGPPGPHGFMSGRGDAYDYIPAWMDVPPLYASENATEPPMAVIKLFNPDGAWTYFILEYDPKEDIAFGLVTGVGYDPEIGYQSLAEVRDVRSAQLHLPMERDLYFKPTPITELPEYIEAFGENGPYAHLAKKQTADANEDAAREKETIRQALRCAAQVRRDLSLQQYIIAMGDVKALTYDQVKEAHIDIFRMGRDILLNTGEVVTIAGFRTTQGYSTVEVLGKREAFAGKHRLPADCPVSFADDDWPQVWEGYVQGVLLDRGQLEDLIPSIPVLQEMAQRWPLSPMDDRAAWAKDDIAFLIEMLDDGAGPILVDTMAMGIPSVRDFIGLGLTQYLRQTVTKDGKYTIAFDVGEAMSYAPSAEARWTEVDVKDGEFPFDTKAVRARLQAILNAPARQPAQPQPEPEHPSVIDPAPTPAPVNEPALPAPVIEAEPTKPEGAENELPEGWTVEDIQYLLKELDEGPILVASTKLGIPNFNTFTEIGGIPVNHAGFGYFVIDGKEWEISFDGGGLMSRTPSGKGWSRVRTKGTPPYQYPTDEVRRTLQAWLGNEAQPQPAAQLAATKPQPSEPADPEPEEPREKEVWQISRTTYMMSKAMFAAGVPIFNSADGDDHEAAVIKALQEGKKVPQFVLDDYPGIEDEAQRQLADPAPVFKKQLTGEAAQNLLLEAAAAVPGMGGAGDVVFPEPPASPEPPPAPPSKPVSLRLEKSAQAKPIILEYGENESQWYFQGEEYLVLKPKNGKDAHAAWSLYHKPGNDWLLCEYEENRFVGGWTIADTLQLAQEKIGLTFRLRNAPPDLNAGQWAEAHWTERVSAAFDEIIEAQETTAQVPNIGTVAMATIEAAPAEPPAADDSAVQAELKEYELEIMTGRVDKRDSCFYNTIARVQPGTLQLALQRIPASDTRRRQEIQRRLGPNPSA